jgi:hypothetical protein
VLLSLLCSGVVSAQTGRITGTVTDSAAGFPVGGVTISVTGLNLGAQSADDGRYTFASVPPGTYTVEARRLGYAPMRRTGVVVTGSQSTALDFKLQAAALHLQQTVITGVVDGATRTTWRWHQNPTANTDEHQQEQLAADRGRWGYSIRVVR